MKFTAHIRDAIRTFDGKVVMTLESRNADCNSISKLLKADGLDVEIEKHRKKRSLDANAYYWLLCSRLAEAVNVSKPYIHNYILRKYGQIELIDGQAVYIVIPDTDEAQRQVDEEQLYHLKPTAEVKEGKDDVMYRTYMMIKGSSKYNTKEMTDLINGLVDECKQIGIETLPPEELERMMAAYGKKIEKRTH